MEALLSAPASLTTLEELLCSLVLLVSVEQLLHLPLAAAEVGLGQDLRAPQVAPDEAGGCETGRAGLRLLVPEL